MAQETGAWMPMYWADYFGDTMHLTVDQHGAYLLLIGVYWRRGRALPDDDRFLANATKCSMKKWKMVRPIVEDFFSLREGHWHHGRLEKEILRSSGRLNSARANGQAGGLAKSKLVTVTVTEGSSLRSDPSAPKARRRLGTPLAIDWQPSVADTAHAQARGFDQQQIVDHADAFRTYWTSGNGRNKSHADWAAAWRIWINKENPKQTGAYVNGTRPDRKPSAHETLFAAAAQVARDRSVS